MSDPTLLWWLALRVLLAIVLGAVIGLERQWRLRTAGIRTNALVSAGAALFVMLGAVSFQGNTHTDPTRVAAQVVSGIGFLGAGVILRDGMTIRGLTTAATLWCAAAVGSLVGAGMGPLALIGALAIVATNVLLRPLGVLLNRRMQPRADALSGPAGSAGDHGSSEYMLEVVTSDKSEPRVRALVLQAVDQPELTLRALVIRPTKDSTMKVTAEVAAADDHDPVSLQTAVRRISLDSKVTSSRWWQVEEDDD